MATSGAASKNPLRSQRANIDVRDDCVFEMDGFATPYSDSGDAAISDIDDSSDAEGN